MKLSEIFYTLKPNLLFCISLPVFVLLYMVLCQPTFGVSEMWVDQWNLHSGFCLSISCAILLGCLLVSRSLLCFAVVRHNLSKWDFAIWQCVEFIVACLFVDLFVALFMHVNYFNTLPQILSIGLALAVVPYVLFWLIMENLDRGHRLREAQDRIEELRKGVERNETGAIRFVDEKGVVKLVIGVDRVISIESAGNYVTILYDNDGKLVRYSLRNSLKNIEDLCSANGLARCHRSFFVNLNKIKVIRRNPEGVFAEMDHAGVDDIPVSKTYAPELLRLFSQ